MKCKVIIDVKRAQRWIEGAVKVGVGGSEGWEEESVSEAKRLLGILSAAGRCDILIRPEPFLFCTRGMLAIASNPNKLSVGS